MNKDYTWFEGYTTQYVDILNCKFLDMDNEKRLKNIPTMAKRFAAHGDEYRKIKDDVNDAEKEYNCPVENIGTNVDYPEDFEW